MLDIFIDMHPEPKARPRFGARGSVYTPQSTRQAESAIKFILKNRMQRDSLPMLEGPISINAVFFYFVPKKFEKLEEEDIRKNLKTTKPDLDNLLKLVLDCLNGIVIKDDAQVCKIVCEKVYTSSSEGVRLQIKEIK